MLWGKAHSQIDLFKCSLGSQHLNLSGNSKQGKNKESFVFSFISHVWEPFTRERPVAAAKFQHLICQRRFDRMLGKAGNKRKMGCFDGIIAVINCYQHNYYLLYLFCNITQLRKRIYNQNALFSRVYTHKKKAGSSRLFRYCDDLPPCRQHFHT